MNCQHIFYSVSYVVFINQNTRLHHIVPRQINWRCVPTRRTTWSPTRHRKAPCYSAPQNYTREARAWQQPWWPLSQETGIESGRQCWVSWLLYQLLWDSPIFVTFLLQSALASASWFWSFVKFSHLVTLACILWPSIIYIFIVLHILIDFSWFFGIMNSMLFWFNKLMLAL